MVFFAGQIVTADQMNDAAEVGETLLNVTATSDSATWNSATKVLTNLFGTFTGRAGGEYEIDVRASVTINGTAYATLGTVYKEGGAAVATDTLCGSGTTLANVSGGVFYLAIKGKFTAVATGPIGVACVGWVAIGSVTSVNLDGSSTHEINRLTVKRVK